MFAGNITLSNRFFLHFLFTTKPCSANTHWIRSVIVLFDVNLIGIDDQFIICIMIVSWNFLLLDEMKCHAIWKMTESASLTIYTRYLRIVLFIFYLFFFFFLPQRWVRAFAPQAEGWVFESQAQQTFVVKPGSDSFSAKRSAIGVSATGPRRYTS